MPRISRRTFIFGGVALLPYMYLERLAVAIRRHKVPVAGLPAAFDGFTILHLSDLHEKEFGAGNSELLSLLDTEKFDMVALTGDLVLGYRPILNAALHLVEGLRGRPIFSVCGNHEWELGQGEEMNRRLREAGAQVLSNGCVPLRSGSSRLWVAGVDDPVTGRARLRQALSGVTGDAPRLLLAHSPHIYDEAVQEQIDVVLTGHTHGGQIRLPLLGAAYVPDMGLFPRYDYGAYRTGKTTMVVNAGLGESLLPLRFNMRPEIVLVTLVATAP